MNPNLSAGPRSAVAADSATRALLKNLELTVTRRLDGILHGDYRGLVPGHGSEPGEARAYQPGDDVRRIDWNVTARLDQPHTRETIADRELETWVGVDLSPSLDFGTANMTKRDLAITATGAIGFLTANTGNRYGLVVADGAKLDTVAARTGRQHLLASLHRMATTPQRTDSPGGTELSAVIIAVESVARRRGLAVIVSDFLAKDAWQLPLARLGVRHETLAIEVIDPRELELPDVGILQVVDPETGRRRDVRTSSPKLRERYREAAQRQRATIAADIRSAGADHLVLRTDGDWVGDLVRFVELRRHRAAHLPRRTR